MLLAVSGEASEAQVRPLRPGDAGSVARLLEQLGYPAEDREVRKRIDAWARDDHGVAFGLIIDDGLAGCAAIHVIPFFERLALEPGSWRSSSTPSTAGAASQACW